MDDEGEILRIFQLTNLSINPVESIYHSPPRICNYQPGLLTLQRLRTNTITEMATIHIDQELLEQATQRAESEGLNINDMIENYIRNLLRSPAPQKIRISPFVEELGEDLGLPVDFDEREAYREHLKKKHK